MVYQRPLYYLLGLEGVALLRAFAGDYDRVFAEARISEMRRLLDIPELSGEGVQAARVSTVDGYRVWSASYDRPGNGLYPFEEPVVHQILSELPIGIALDAACGTGRHADYLSTLGHHVLGVDSSPDMLDLARRRVPDAEFQEGELQQLPLPDNHADIVVCGLALTHVRDLEPVFAEFARVLRPGGHLVISDVHQEQVTLGSVPRARSAAGEPELLPAFRHRASDYLGALCQRVCRCAVARSLDSRATMQARQWLSTSSQDLGMPGPGRCTASSRRRPAPRARERLP